MKSTLKLLHLLTITALVIGLSAQNVLPAKAVAPDQSISILTNAPLNAADGESFTVAATSDSGLEVTYSAAGVCTNVGALFTMTSGSGTCTVQYDQAGDGTYNPALQVTEDVTAQPSATPTATLTATDEPATVTPTETPTPTSALETSTATATPTLETDTPTATASATVTATATASETGTITATTTLTTTATKTVTKTATKTVTKTATKTTTKTVTATATRTVTATKTKTSTITATPTQPTMYVSPAGNDANSCTSPTQTCRTINGALSKANAQAAIKVAVGTYTGGSTAVVSITKSVTLLGGWNANFTAQNGMSTIDGQNARQGISIIADTTIPVIIDHFISQHGYSVEGGGIGNIGAGLTLNNSIVQNNIGTYSGGGISNEYGILTINNTIITENYSLAGGGIYNGMNNHYTMTLNHSVVRMNTTRDDGSGIYNNNNNLVILNDSTVSNNINTNSYYFNAAIVSSGAGNTTTLNNSTVSGNTGIGIVRWSGNIIINNSTITANRYGIVNDSAYAGKVIMQNSILAGNTAKDCSGPITSSGYNLIGNVTCTFIAKTGDLINLNAKLGQMTGFPGYVPLLLGSPAINTGNPATCLSIDQRGLTRPQGGRCDMGSYEYKTPGIANSLGILAGSSQGISASGVYPIPLTVYVVDSIGSPVQGVTVTFAAPLSGPTGKFGNSYTVSVFTNVSGIATAPTFTANNQPGSYTVRAMVPGLSGSPAMFELTNWPIPITLSPAGATDFSSPTYQWMKVAGATQYQFELWDDGHSQVVYTKTVSASVCGNTICSSTPIEILNISAFSQYYKWKVRAMVDSVWRSFSAYKIFTVTTRPGLWSGPGVEFYVTPDRIHIANFAVYLSVSGCGDYKITNTIPVFIDNTMFSFAYSALIIVNDGGIWTPTTAGGNLHIYDLYIPGCGYVSSGPYAWGATWQNGNQPAATIQDSITLIPVQPSLSGITAPSPFTVERIKP